MLNNDELMEEDDAGPFIRTKDRDRHQQLADAVKRRRTELGLNQEEARTAGGIGQQTWSHLENAKLRDQISLRVIAGIEKAMRWKRESVQWVLLGGGEPVPLELEPTPEFLLEQLETYASKIVSLEQRLEAMEEICKDVETTLNSLKPLMELMKNLRS